MTQGKPHGKLKNVFSSLSSCLGVGLGRGPWAVVPSRFVVDCGRVLAPARGRVTTKRVRPPPAWHGCAFIGRVGQPNIIIITSLSISSLVPLATTKGGVTLLLIFNKHVEPKLTATAGSEGEFETQLVGHFRFISFLLLFYPTTLISLCFLLL